MRKKYEYYYNALLENKISKKVLNDLCEEDQQYRFELIGSVNLMMLINLYNTNNEKIQRSITTLFSLNPAHLKNLKIDDSSLKNLSEFKKIVAFIAELYEIEECAEGLNQNETLTKQIKENIDKYKIDSELFYCFIKRKHFYERFRNGCIDLESVEKAAREALQVQNVKGKYWISKDINIGIALTISSVYRDFFEEFLRIYSLIDQKDQVGIADIIEKGKKHGYNKISDYSRLKNINPRNLDNIKFYVLQNKCDDMLNVGTTKYQTLSGELLCNFLETNDNRISIVLKSLDVDYLKKCFKDVNFKPSYLFHMVNCLFLDDAQVFDNFYPSIKIFLMENLNNHLDKINLAFVAKFLNNEVAIFKELINYCETYMNELFLKKAYDSAITLAKSIFSINPSDPSAQYLVEKAYRASFTNLPLKDALTRAEEYCKYNFHRTSSYLIFAEIYRSHNMPLKAVENYNRCISESDLQSSCSAKLAIGEMLLSGIVRFDGEKNHFEELKKPSFSLGESQLVKIQNKEKIKRAVQAYDYIRNLDDSPSVLKLKLKVINILNGTKQTYFTIGESASLPALQMTHEAQKLFIEHFLSKNKDQVYNLINSMVGNLFQQNIEQSAIISAQAETIKNLQNTYQTQETTQKNSDTENSYVTDYK